MTANTAELTRTQLTAYETESLHNAALAVTAHSFEVGAFVTRYGQPESLERAADLYLEMLDKLTNDANIRTGALEYGLFAAESRAQDRHASQARQLCGEFLAMLFDNAIADRADAIADRADAKVGA